MHVGVLHRPLRRGRDPVELLVARQLEESRLGAARLKLHDRKAAGAQHLLVHGLHERLGRRGRRDRAHVALLNPRRVPDEDLRERVYPGIPHAAWTLSTSHSCTERSSPSSGWKATASTFPSRTATGCPSISASTSTPLPTSSIHGARMKIACTGWPSNVRSASNDAS